MGWNCDNCGGDRTECQCKASDHAMNDIASSLSTISGQLGYLIKLLETIAPKPLPAPEPGSSKP